MRPSINDASAAHTTLLAHFAYGAATGALLPYLERGCGNRFFTGAVFGLGVWAASYLGWIPAANIMTPATRHPSKRNALMLAAHLAWGAALAVVCAALRATSCPQERANRCATRHNFGDLRTNETLLQSVVLFSLQAKIAGHWPDRFCFHPELSESR